MPHHGTGHHGKAYHGAGQSNVGSAAFYEDGDQRHESPAAIRERMHFEKLLENQHRKVDTEAEMNKRDPTRAATIHGNKPSKGAVIDKELMKDDELRLREKGVFK